MAARVISPIGAILAWALFMDAIQSERMANEILLDSIADRRVSSPSVERLQTEAASLASRTQRELMSTLAMTRAITDHRLRRSSPRSGPATGRVPGGTGSHTRNASDAKLRSKRL